MTSRLGWLVCVAALGVAPVLRADETPAPSTQPVDAERLGRRLERWRERSRALAASAASSVAPPSPSALPVAERAEALARRWAAWTASRQARGERQRAELARQVGAKLNDPELRAELELHARRVAELARLEFLAQNARDGAERERLLTRIGKLSAREDERHRRRLARWSAPSSAPSASAAASSAAPSASAAPGARSEAPR